jgi:hypothetical protein
MTNCGKILILLFFIVSFDIGPSLFCSNEPRCDKKFAVDEEDEKEDAVMKSGGPPVFALDSNGDLYSAQVIFVQDDEDGGEGVIRFLCLKIKE